MNAQHVDSLAAAVEALGADEHLRIALRPAGGAVRGGDHEALRHQRAAAELGFEVVGVSLGQEADLEGVRVRVGLAAADDAGPHVGGGGLGPHETEPGALAQLHPVAPPVEVFGCAYACDAGQGLEPLEARRVHGHQNIGLVGEGRHVTRLLQGAGEAAGSGRDLAALGEPLPVAQQLLRAEGNGGPDGHPDAAFRLGLRRERREGRRQRGPGWGEVMQPCAGACLFRQAEGKGGRLRGGGRREEQGGEEESKDTVHLGPRCRRAHECAQGVQNCRFSLA